MSRIQIFTGHMVDRIIPVLFFVATLVFLGSVAGSVLPVIAEKTYVGALSSVQIYPGDAVLLIFAEEKPTEIIASKSALRRFRVGDCYAANLYGYVEQVPCKEATSGRK